jgi:hypothetical protein
MNKRTLLVMKWLNNPESVSQLELEENARDAAYWAADTSVSVDYAAWAAWAAAYAASAASAAATYWVNEYFESTGENKQTYIDSLG